MNPRTKILVGVAVVAVLGTAALLSISQSRGQGIEVRTADEAIRYYRHGDYEYEEME